MKLPSPSLPASSLQILSMLMRLSPLLLMVFSLLYSCILFVLWFILICSRWGSGEQKESFPLLTVSEGQNICPGLHCLSRKCRFRVASDDNVHKKVVLDCYSIPLQNSR